MLIPTVENFAYDRKKRITYVVMASRTLTEPELQIAVGSYLADLEKGERPRRGQALVIYSEL
jgi:hypothetical protein